MLTDYLTTLTERFHDLGHDRLLLLAGTPADPSVNAAMDAAAGYGHRLVEGHDFHGLLDSFHLGGIHGVETWFDHMLKDWTTHDGIPLPGAQAVMDITGMDFHQAVDWLCINAGDVIEAGGAVACFTLLKDKLQRDPRLNAVALALAGALGISDDNPLLLAYAGIEAAKHIQARYRVLSDESMRAASAYVRLAYAGLQTVAVASFVGVTALHLVGLDLIDWLSHAPDAAHVLDLVGAGPDAAHALDAAAHAPDVAADLLDGLAGLGLGILASRAVKWFLDRVNSPLRDHAATLDLAAKTMDALRSALVAGADDAIIVPLAEQLARHGFSLWRLKPCSSALPSAV